MSWKERLDELRREAVSKMYVWREETSLLKRSTPTADGRLKVSISPEEGQAILRTQAISVINGWHVVLSLAVVKQEVEPAVVEQEAVWWHFSGMLYPRGRGSTEKDWKWIGTMVGYLSGPAEPMFWPTNPNEPHHWSWPANGIAVADLDKDDRDDTRSPRPEP